MNLSLWNNQLSGFFIKKFSAAALSALQLLRAASIWPLPSACKAAALPPP